MPRRFLLCLCLGLPAAAGLCPARATALVQDHAVTVHTARSAAERRETLIGHIWGPEGFPHRRRPDAVRTNVTCPVAGLDHLAGVEELRIHLAPGLEGLAWHFVPEQPNGQLVVVHHGHACTLDDDPGPGNRGYGLQRTIHALLAEGCGVLGVFMPRQRPGDCTGGHEALFQIRTPGSPMRFFLEPTAVSLNHAKAARRPDRRPVYREFHMLGLSGGGWTTTLYAAIDPTIRCSFSIAGTLPLHLRTGGSIGDREQFDPALYQLAGYPDLYILGAHGAGRAQVQILVRRDDCCFGQAQHDPTHTGLSYDAAVRACEDRVRLAVARSGTGTFRLEIDEDAPSHMISHQTIQNIVLPALRAARGGRRQP